MSSTGISLADTALQARIRDKLNQENVKLWTEPFIREDKTVVDSEVLALASRYAIEFEFQQSEVAECLFNLQRTALERVAERDHFKNTGYATIRIKFSGTTKLSGELERIQVNLRDTTGKELKSRIAGLISSPENCLKLICLGRVLQDDAVLELQNVKNGAQIMVLIVGSDQEAFLRGEDQFRQLEETRGAAGYLAGRTKGGDYSLQVADQHGKPLDLPEAEKQALAIALALHEKGRSALKAAEFSKALVFLLEADSVYSQCHASILDMVDNYGLLNLDIAWCYLSLQSISELPAVEARLTKCENVLQRTYGEHMERVIALKGSSGWEAALFVRLHLLQGISSYHLGHVEKSKFYLAKVESEIQRLTVSDEQLVELINMGYGPDEARIALRATFGNPTAAVDWIIRRRDEKREIKKQEQNERLRQKLQEKLGVCENGEPVNVAFWRNLKEMGLDSSVARSALKKANNDINNAVQFASDPIFIASVIEQLPPQPPTATTPQNQVNSTTQTQLNLAQNTPPQPSTSGGPNPTAGSSFSELAQAGMDEFFGLAPETLSEAQILRNQEEAEKSQKAYESLAKDICSEAEYIDLALSAETNYLNQYKTLLHM